MDFKLMTEIGSVSIGNSQFENEYTFYSDGSVIHEYDRDETYRNVVDQITVADIAGDVRDEILKTCPAQFKQKIRDLFNQY